MVEQPKTRPSQITPVWMTVLVLLVHSVLIAGGADTNFVEDFRKLADLGREKDWSKDHVRIEGMIENLFEKKGWNGESDQFARKLALEVSAIPPWQPMERFNRFHEEIVERYRLSDDNALQLRAKMTREAGRFHFQHGPLVLRQLREGMGTRAAKKPFTAEQVARWTKESQPIIDEVQGTVERMCKEIAPLMDAESQELLSRDLESFTKRHKVVEDIAARWSQGEWTPNDWGLGDDPVHMHAEAMEKMKRASASRSDVPAKTKASTVRMESCDRSDPTTWEGCVKVFGEKYGLDVGQQSAAESIMLELRERAEDYLRSRADLVSGIHGSARESDEAFAPVRAYYEEMSERLLAVLTSSQRAQASG